MPTDCLSEFAELLESQGLANSAVFYSVNQLLSRCNLNCVMSKRQRLICCTFGSFVWNATCYPCTLWNNDLLFISYTIYSLYHIRNVICNTVYDIIQWNFQHIAYEINNKSYIISYTYGFKSYDVVYQGHEILFSFYIMISLVSYARITCTNRMKLNNKSYLISHASLLQPGPRILLCGPRTVQKQSVFQSSAAPARSLCLSVSIGIKSNSVVY